MELAKIIYSMYSFLLMISVILCEVRSFGFVFNGQRHNKLIQRETAEKGGLFKKTMHGTCLR